MTSHIKIPAIEPVVRYLADGVQDTYVYPFPIFASEDLSVYLDGAKQISGYDISGAGNTTGGRITFDTPPEEDVVIVLARKILIERTSDFIQGADFSAKSINTELDYLVASLQQVQRENDRMLQYSDYEMPGVATLPDKDVRKNKALGFDGEGNPVAVSLEGSMAAPDYTASGSGAVTRTSHDKFGDAVSAKDFGAQGDGLTDDTLAIQQALTAHDSVFLPSGDYLITGPIALREKQSLYGTGAASRLKCNTTSFDAVRIIGGFTRLHNLAIDGGDRGVLLYGYESACVQNTISDIQIIGANIGIELDGYTNAEKPCYWNNFTNILIESFGQHGVYLKTSGAGDTPNANRFARVRSYSKGTASTGSGFYIQSGALNNSFIDCEANVNGASADSCFRIGAGASDTLILNLLTESNNLTSNLKLDNGSTDSFILNLIAMSDGAAIEDNSGGQYNALNAGYPDKNTLRKTAVTDLKAALMRYDTEYIDSAGTTLLDLSHTIHIVNAINGDITLDLPTASSDNNGAVITVKKVDQSDNIVIIDEEGGDGPDGTPLKLGEHNDYATVISNGAAWYVIASNRAPGSTQYIDATGTVDIDMAVDTYLVSSYSGALTTRLPPADAAEAIGRTITIKKTDPSFNAVTVTEQGGAGPDLSSQSLSSRYDAITVVSNGAQWYVLSKYS